jgi:hypothetical protein
MVQQADIVRTQKGEDYVVVDVAVIENEGDAPDEHWAVLRPQGVLYPDRFPPAQKVETLEVIGHLNDIPGWEVMENGRWRKVDD